MVATSALREAGWLAVALQLASTRTFNCTWTALDTRMGVEEEEKRRFCRLMEATLSLGP